MDSIYGFSFSFFNFLLFLSFSASFFFFGEFSADILSRLLAICACQVHYSISSLQLFIFKNREVCIRMTTFPKKFK